MKIPEHAGFFPALTFAVTLIEIVLFSLPSWYLYPILLLVFWGVAYLTRRWPDRLLYLCAARCAVGYFPQFFEHLGRTGHGRNSHRRDPAIPGPAVGPRQIQKIS